MHTGLVMMPRIYPVNSMDDVKDTIKTSGGVGRAYRYCHGNGEPHYPVPAVICRVVRFPEGNPFTEFPGAPYVNWLQYRNNGTPDRPSYETVRRTFYNSYGEHYTIIYADEVEE